MKVTKFHIGFLLDGTPKNLIPFQKTPMELNKIQMKYGIPES